MKIIFGATSFDAHAHAKRALRAKRKADERDGRVVPYGINTGLSKFMHSCDDCGDTYWDADEYGFYHKGCRKGRAAVGF